MFRIRLLTFCTTPRGPVRADHLREPALAAVAVADGGPRCDLLDRVRRNVDDLKTARGRELLAQDVIEQADALDFYPCGRLERSIDELEAEEGNPRHFLAVRPRVRSTDRHDGEEDSQCCLHGGGLRLGLALAKLGCRLAINAQIVTLLPANHCGIEDGLERPPR